MTYKVVYEVSGQKILLGKYNSRLGAEKRVCLEKQKDNFGNNGYREYIGIKLSN
jgi:hypothetical protein